MPILSVIVPIYQANEYLEKCIDSILEQSFSDFELILVDDGSDDGSKEICNTYAKNDKRVKIICQENQGVSSARNTGLDYASGRYIAFVDADDWIDENLFKVSMMAMIKSKADVVSYGFIKEIWHNEEKKVLLKGIPALEGTISKKSMREYIIKQKGEINVNVFSYIFKRELIEKIRFHTEMPYAEDAVFVMEALTKAKIYCLMKTAGYHYNTRIGSAAYRWQPEMVDCYKKSYNAMLSFFKSLRLSRQQANEIMAVKVMNGYASLIYNLCLPTCPLKMKEKMTILKSARKEFRVDFYRKMYKIDANSLFERAKTVLMIGHMERILVGFGTLYCRRNS